MKPVRIGIAGASGRMGRKLLGVTYRFEGAVLAAALEYAGHPLLGTDAALLAGQPDKSANQKQISLSNKFNKSVNVYVDFSTPAAAVELSKKCRKHKIPMIVGVTGFSKEEEEELQAASADIPLFISPNMSAGMLSMFNIVQRAASLLKNSDVEICETHHRHKKDAPSGTALRLGKIVAKARNVSFGDVAVFDRERQDNTRGENEIGFSSIRGGDIVGEHRVIFANTGEQIEIIHRSTNRITYAAGAILSAMHIVGQPAKLYSTEDILKIIAKKNQTPRRKRNQKTR